MDVSQLVQQKLNELRLEQRELANAAEVTESYISQLLSRKKMRRSGRSSLNSQFHADFSAALLEFNGEAVLYCRGISDTVAHEYAMDYTRMLQNRAAWPYPTIDWFTP